LVNAYPDIKHFNRVVAKRSHIEPVRGRIERHVIDATLHVWKLDRPNQCQRIVMRSARLNRHCSEHQENDATPHLTFSSPLVPAPPRMLPAGTGFESDFSVREASWIRVERFHTRLTLDRDLAAGDDRPPFHGTPLPARSHPANLCRSGADDRASW
jgi:hypothetical protein